MRTYMNDAADECEIPQQVFLAGELVGLQLACVLEAKVRVEEHPELRPSDPEGRYDPPYLRREARKE